MKVLKLHNASHKNSPEQQAYGLVNQSVAVDGKLLDPKTTKDVEEKDKERIEAEHAHLFSVGVLEWTESTPNALRQLEASQDVQAPEKFEVVEEPTFMEKKKKDR